MASSSNFRTSLRHHNVIYTRATFSRTKASAKWCFPASRHACKSGPSLGFFKLKPCSNSAWISWFEYGFWGFKQLRVTNSHARIAVYWFYCMALFHSQTQRYMINTIITYSGRYLPQKPKFCICDKHFPANWLSACGDDNRKWCILNGEKLSWSARNVDHLMTSDVNKWRDVTQNVRRSSDLRTVLYVKRGKI